MKKMQDIMLGNRIKNLRISLKMNQKQFSDCLNTKVSTLSNWENGRNKPNMEKLSKIAELANVSIEELLGNPKRDYALKHSRKILDDLISLGDPFPEFPQATFTKKYYDELIYLVKDSIETYDLDKYSNEEIEEITDNIVGDLILQTPKNTRELLFKITMSLEHTIDKISGYMGKEIKNFRTLNVSEELDGKTVKQALNILRNTQKEIEKLYPNSKKRR